MGTPKESEQSHVDPYEGRVADSVIKGASDVTTCFRLSESAGGLERSAGCPEGATRGVNRVRDRSGRSVEIIYRLAATDSFEI
jgi:hypothetical protein